MRLGTKKEEIPNLRPPTLMIDLLFGALMLFAFQMGDPSARPLVPHDFELPTSDKSPEANPASLLPLKPVKSPAGSWAYVAPDGSRLSPTQVKATARKGKLTPVLLVPASASVQTYLDAEHLLRLQGLKVGLAVVSEGAQP